MKVFISHSSRDVWVAQRIATDLQERGIDVFIDENDLETGDVFDEKLRDNLRDSDEVLLLLSPVAVQSAWVLMEIGAAWALDKRLVPILHGLGVNELPDAIDKRQARELNAIDRYYDELLSRTNGGGGTARNADPVVTAPSKTAGEIVEAEIPHVLVPLPGDPVRIAEGRPAHIRRPDGRIINFAEDMERYLGVVTTVQATDNDDGSATLAIDDEGHWWAWEWFEALKTHALRLEDVPVGARIKHPHFGAGVVTHCEVDGDGGVNIDVKLDSGDEIQFDLSTTPLALE